jgi:serine/threonine protein kinase
MKPAATLGRTGCPTENALARFVEGNLLGTDRASTEAHLADCNACQEVLTRLVQAGRGDTAASTAEESRTAPSAEGHVCLELEPGDRVGRYRIERLLGQGGMGRVYQAHDELLGRDVALKLTHPDAAGRRSNESASAAWVVREARAAAALKHRSAVAIFDVGEIEGRPFIAMELLEGKTLRAFIGRPEVPLDIRSRWLVEVADVLDAAHALGLVHRDVKPDNVMVCNDGSVRVLDFGIAKRLEAGAPSSVPGAAPASERDALRTATGHVRGTPLYMAPEQREGSLVDGRSDQYAWALMAFELLSGALPVSRATPPLLSEIAPVPFEVAALVMKALSMDPGLRHPSMQDILRQLEPFAAPLPARPERTDAERANLLGDTDALPTEGRRLFPTRGSIVGRLASTRSKRRSVALALAVVALLLTLAAVSSRYVARSAPRKGGESTESVLAADGPGPTTVLLLGFENKSGDPLFDETVDAVLEAELDRSAAANPFAGSSLRRLVSELAPELRFPSDPPGREAVASDLAALIRDRTRRPVALVHGTILSTDEGVRLAIALRVVPGGDKKVVVRTSTLRRHPRGAPSFSGRSLEVAVGVLAKGILAALGEPESAGKEVDASGLSNLIDADHEFAIGSVELGTEEEADALVHLQHAVNIDPGFAWARARLGAALASLGRTREAVAQFDAARSAFNRLPDRERTFAAAADACARDDREECVADYEELLRRWPLEPGAEVDLALAYERGRRFSKALEVARTARKEHPTAAAAGEALARLLAITEDFGQAAILAQEIIVQTKERDREAYEVAVLANAMLGNRATVLDLLARRKRIDASGAARQEADFALFEGRLGDAATALANGIQSDEHASNPAVYDKWAMLADVRLRLGDKDGARAAAERALASGEIATLYDAGRVLAEVGDEAAWKRAAARIAESPGQTSKLFVRLLAILGGRHAGEATAGSSNLPAGTDSFIECAELGKAYLDAGAFDDAARELEACATRRGDAVAGFPGDGSTLRELGPALYRLARAKYASGRPGYAPAYRAFLELEPNSRDDPWAREALERSKER